MEIILRALQLLVKIIYIFVYPLLLFFLPNKNNPAIPPIRNKTLTLPLIEVLDQIRKRKLKSETLVDLYISRIEEVNPHINAVVEDRFEEARKDARHADKLISRSSDEQLVELLEQYPLLGVPFTVKEACGLKGLSFVVGSRQRLGQKSPDNGDCVKLLRAAGGVPLLVSANPEYCFSIETNTYTHGKCLNPYDSMRTSGGSSGGEGALNGAGASLFGVGSDIAGSIRIPCLFNGLYGHKPTAGLTSVKGHFPDSDDSNFENYLQIGPITRFAKDLDYIMHIMAGKKAALLRSPVETRKIKIYYSLGFDGFNGVLHSQVSDGIKSVIMKAIKCFQQMGVIAEPINFKGFRNSTEIALSGIVRLKNFPYLINNPSQSKLAECLWEYVKSIFGNSMYTKDGMVFELMRRANSFMPQRNLEKYRHEAEDLKQEIVNKLGHDGVLFFPTFHKPAIHHHTSHLPLWGVDYTLIFNVLGLPATHIPMGLDSSGLPVGFQVVAAPYNDELCFKIATELEAAIGGWVPPPSLK